MTYFWIEVADQFMANTNEDVPLCPQSMVCALIRPYAHARHRGGTHLIRDEGSHDGLNVDGIGLKSHVGHCILLGLLLVILPDRILIRKFWDWGGG